VCVFLCLKSDVSCDSVWMCVCLFMSMWRRVNVCLWVWVGVCVCVGGSVCWCVFFCDWIFWLPIYLSVSVYLRVNVSVCLSQRNIKCRHLRRFRLSLVNLLSISQNWANLICRWWFNFRLKPIYITDPAASKNNAWFKSGQKKK